ncbi:unnamed protein product [Dovyalis caffra]|uniref:Transmembrane protein n=1 Tax=Dovyalis caffra TaxID=77055 RepID=A0AAV1RIR8_9ROSI|nr:unnamed protein product [Dovyalis caffra]
MPVASNIEGVENIEDHWDVAYGYGWRRKSRKKSQIVEEDQRNQEEDGDWGVRRKSRSLRRTESEGGGRTMKRWLGWVWLFLMGRIGWWVGVGWPWMSR